MARSARRPPVQRDLALLLPAFRPLVATLVANLRSQGHDPRVWETLRTPQRGAWLKAQGKSQTGSRSIHCYGAAVDIIHRTDFWRNRDFFKALGAEAEKLGLTWGGSWKMRDYPHVQAIPVSAQKAFRAMTAQERDAHIAERFGVATDAPARSDEHEETTEAERAARASLPEDQRYEDECCREPAHESADASGDAALTDGADAVSSDPAAAAEGESVDTPKPRKRRRRTKRAGG